MNTDICLRADDPTTLAFVSLLQGENDEPRYMFYANDSVDRLLITAELPTLSPTIQVLHFGSISLVMEPAATALTALMLRESRKRIISLDPNVRPGLITNRTVYQQRFESWVRLVDIVRLSQVDFEYLYPSADPAQIIPRWLEKGVSLCILTLGVEGSMGFTADGATAVSTVPEIEVADTVGAGDTFLAAALAYLYEAGKLNHHQQLCELSPTELTNCLTYAGQAAAINCARQGANPPTKREMETKNVK